MSPNVPRLPPKFLPRPEDLDALKAKILGSGQQPVAVTGIRRGMSIQGMGGIGKSVLAAAIARDEAVRQAFPDGVFWVSLGQEPNVLSLQTELARELGEKTPDFSNISDGKKFLTERLAMRCCFVVLDDIWRDQHLRSFDVLGDRCQMLITTRDSAVVTGIGAVEYSLDFLSLSQARQLLADWTGYNQEALPVQADEIIRECGYLPLALSMAGAMLKKSRRWDRMLKRLQRADLDKIKQQFPDYDYPDLLKMLQVSVDYLEPELQERYLDFVVFPEEARIPQGVLETFWALNDLDELDVGDMVDDLVAKSLLRRDDQDNLFLHDLQYDYITKQVGDPSRRHQQLLDAYRIRCKQGWASGPQDGYFLRQLTRHMSGAGMRHELRSLLLNSDWLRVQLYVNEINALPIDYGRMPNDNVLKLLRSTLQLSTHVLALHPEQLTERLWGHLRDKKQPEFVNLLGQVATQKLSVWLQPLHVNLAIPGGPLLQTFESHIYGISSVALSADRLYALSGSYDKTLKFWDLVTGEVRWSLEGHTSRVMSVVLSADGTLALSGSDDRTLRLWDLKTGKILRILEGHEAPVNSVALSATTSRALSGSSDETLRLWDLRMRETLLTLKGHEAKVNSVALSSDEHHALSGSDDGTLRLWDLKTGEVLRILKGHRAPVNSVALSATTSHALSGSSDETLRLWDVSTGKTLRVLEGHDARINSVAISADKNLALSGSDDRTLRLWDLSTGVTLRKFEGHSSGINSVALGIDRSFTVSNSESLPLSTEIALSGSTDKTIKFWDLTMEETTHTLQGHDSKVYSMALSVDGAVALSASNDKTLRLWDVSTGKTLRVLEGHDARINSVAISADKNLALSGSDDRTLRLWDLSTGVTLRKFEGHSSGINSVALNTDQNLALSGSTDRTVKLWDLTTGEVRHTLEGHSVWVRSVALNAKGTLALSGSDDRTLKFWDLTTGKLLRTFEGHDASVNSVTLNVDETLALSGSDDRTVKLWSVVTGDCLATFCGDHPFCSCDMSADGVTIVAGDAAGTVHFFSVIQPEN